MELNHSRDRKQDSENCSCCPSDVKVKTEYKLKSKGIWIQEVYAAYTSTFCNRCGAVGIRDKGIVGEPYARPDDNAQEVTTPDIREALDGINDSGIADIIPRKDVNPVYVQTYLTSVPTAVFGETNMKNRNNLQVTEQLLANVSQESATQKMAFRTKTKSLSEK